ncbi:hypothetical protein [Paenibacillus amylolyticus]|uniref:Uncharacterized protein n=1 Tax=Paenibacillus amylolyticus TaxID=1451 RepID=A0A100VP49_PAEAM|nr:hypothetical protein [Paenibacillus amylolyticus]GAS83424.1 unknown protein [Paenibacillus amylolyticus]
MPLYGPTPGFGNHNSVGCGTENDEVSRGYFNVGNGASIVPKHPDGDEVMQNRLLVGYDTINGTTWSAGRIENRKKVFQIISERLSTFLS